MQPVGTVVLDPAQRPPYRLALGPPKRRQRAWGAGGNGRQRRRVQRAAGGVAQEIERLAAR